MNNGAETGPVRSYVLRSGRISSAQKRSYEKLSALYRVPFSAEPLDFAALFENNNPVIIEIGFGMGIATARMAEACGGVNYLGIEVYRPGIGRLLWEIEKRELKNIRIIEYDAVEVLKHMIASESVSGFHVFFPDPWPKKRHNKRRLITRPFTSLLASRLAPDAYVYMVTDWEDYAFWALRELSLTPGLVNEYPGEENGGGKAGGFAPPLDWRPRTKFEEKGLAKHHTVKELFFRKKREKREEN
jgi:tRNA (guanine-N7-)-methyltransferase